MLKDELQQWLKSLQDEICSGLEEIDTVSKFTEEIWTREEGGGGRTRVIQDGSVFEKGGVNFSAVFGNTPDFLKHSKEHSVTSSHVGDNFFATGISIVIHPFSPLVPIIHMNIRYFEMDNGIAWLGGGIDLTPIYVDEAEARFFHGELKKLCNQFNPDYYPRFKKWADEYFFIPHRNETRGIGGIFFDRIKINPVNPDPSILEFWKRVGKLFLPVYKAIIQPKIKLPFTEEQKKFQLIRRGRYVEFNLVYDKGTRFGLETNGRVESILMSLPKHVSWQYNFSPKTNTPEFETLNRLRVGTDW